MKMNPLLLGVTAFTFLLSAFCPSSKAVEVSFEEDNSLPIVYLNFAVKGGSATDPKGQSGLANFVGEMLLRGTKNRTKEQTDTALDQMGAKIDVETRTDALIVRGSVLSSQLKPFLELVEEIVTEPRFPDNEIRKLKSQIISAILEELGDDSTLGQLRFEKFLFHGHPYGNPILGKQQDIDHLTRDQILTGYQRLFQDRYLLAIGSGDAKASEITNWAQKIGKLRENSKSQTLPEITAPENVKERRVILIDKPDRTQTQIYIGQVGVKMSDHNFFPLYIENQAFGGRSFNTRLMNEIRTKRGWSYGAGSSFRFGKEPRFWVTHLFPASKDTPAALAYTLQMISDLKSSGLTEPEFNFAKESLINSVGFMYDTPAKRVENKLIERTLSLPDGYMESYGVHIQPVMLSESNTAIEDFLKPNELTVIVVGTASELRDKIAQSLSISPDKIDVVPYTQE